MSRMVLYGRVGLERGHCDACGSEAFIVGGRLQCCDAEVKKERIIRRVTREAEALGSRLKSAQKEHILKIQQWRCYLCGTDLRERLYYLTRSGKPRQLRVEYDHFIPRVFCQNNSNENIYAMCSLCNGMKGSKMFDTRDDAIEHIMKRRAERGQVELYTDLMLGAAGIQK